jgi:hypothetical protein
MEMAHLVRLAEEGSQMEERLPEAQVLAEEDSLLL